jgi:hypothetical protein
MGSFNTSFVFMHTREAKDVSAYDLYIYAKDTLRLLVCNSGGTMLEEKERWLVRNIKMSVSPVLCLGLPNECISFCQNDRSS